MSENNSQAQVQEQSIQLTLTPEETRAEQEQQLNELTEKKEEEAAKVAPQKTIEEMLDDAKLNDAEKKQVNDFSETIDIMQANAILNYGSAAQKKITDFSDAALKNVKTRDLGEIGDLLGQLVGELKDADPNQKEEKKGIFGFFKKGADKVSNFKIKYDNAEKNVDKIASILEDHQIQLLKDVSLLDQLYERNQQNSKELSMYIIAGKKRLQEVRENELPKLIAKAKETGLPEDAQAANDLSQACDRFEKKIYDLELTRQVAVQMGPQIRLLQNNDTLMTEKIQSTIVNTIPLWKSQMVLALGIAHSAEAAQAQRQVTDITNELLRKNAEMLHTATVETAKESERGIVDLETLQKTNADLIQTLDDVMRIQMEGRQKRQAAESEMRRMEDELKRKLLEIRQ